MRKKLNKYVGQTWALLFVGALVLITVGILLTYLQFAMTGKIPVEKGMALTIEEAK